MQGDGITSNQAEYCAILLGLKCAYDEGLRTLKVKGDSELVIRHLTGDYQVRDNILRKYFERVHAQLKLFRAYELEHIPRERNNVCDELAKSAAASARPPKQVVIVYCLSPRIHILE
jgi:ribonuclease HI